MGLVGQYSVPCWASDCSVNTVDYRDTVTPYGVQVADASDLFFDFLLSGALNYCAVSGGQGFVIKLERSSFD
jgi:hypothetical protein